MKKYSYVIVALTILLCGAMPTKVMAQSAPGAADDENNKATSYVLDVIPIDQHSSTSQYDDYNCFIASMFMVLDYFGEDITYDELIPIVRGNDENALAADPAFVFGVTQGRLLATGEFTTQLASIIEEELTQGHPVIVAIRNMSLLAENWNSIAGHAVVVYGIHNGWFFYVDPFNGERYSMSAQPFVEASLYSSGSFVITFENSD